MVIVSLAVWTEPAASATKKATGQTVRCPSMTSVSRFEQIDRGG
jgi:hypothetical protein